MGIGKLVSVPIHCTHDLYNTFQVQNSLFYYSTTAPANAVSDSVVGSAHYSGRGHGCYQYLPAGGRNENG